MIQPIASKFSARLISLLLLNGSGDGDSAVNIDGDLPPAANQQPIAIAGNDRTVPTGSSMNLNGNQSRDPHGQELTFHWQVISTPLSSSASLSSKTTFNSSFTADLMVPTK